MLSGPLIPEDPKWDAPEPEPRSERNPALLSPHLIAEQNGWPKAKPLRKHYKM